MGLMTFREENQARWIGVRPAHRGTQIIGHGRIANGTVDILQITAGTLGYITEITVGAWVTVAGDVFIYWTNAADVVQETLFRVTSGITTVPMVLPIKYWPSLEIGDNHKIRARSSVAGLTVTATAKGWEE